MRHTVHLAEAEKYLTVQGVHRALIERKYLDPLQLSDLAGQYGASSGSYLGVILRKGIGFTGSFLNGYLPYQGDAARLPLQGRLKVSPSPRRAPCLKVEASALTTYREECNSVLGLIDLIYERLADFIKQLDSTCSKCLPERDRLRAYAFILTRLHNPIRAWHLAAYDIWLQRIRKCGDLKHVQLESAYRAYRDHLWEDDEALPLTTVRYAGLQPLLRVYRQYHAPLGLRTIKAFARYVGYSPQQYSRIEAAKCEFPPRLINALVDLLPPAWRVILEAPDLYQRRRPSRAADGKLPPDERDSGSPPLITVVHYEEAPNFYDRVGRAIGLASDMLKENASAGKAFYRAKIIQGLRDRLLIGIP